MMEHSHRVFKTGLMKFKNTHGVQDGHQKLATIHKWVFFLLLFLKNTTNDHLTIQHFNLKFVNPWEKKGINNKSKSWLWCFLSINSWYGAKQIWLDVDFHTIKIQDASTNYTCAIMDQGKFPFHIKWKLVWNRKQKKCVNMLSKCVI